MSIFLIVIEKNSKRIYNISIIDYKSKKAKGENIMKKFISLLLVCLMVVPFGMLATTGISAAGEIYVSNTGDDANAGTDSAPVKTLGKAYELVGTAGGTIVVKGTVDITENFYAPAHTGKVTVKGAGSDATIKSSVRYGMGGPTEITNLKIEAAANTMLLALYNDLTVTETVTCTSPIFVTNGQHNAPHTPKSNTITLNGGSYKDVILNMRNGIPAEATQESYNNINVTLNVGGTADIMKIAAW